ncbi:hypothetical protein [Streptomyces canus]|uniref:hypothetical protein n=1 Tax=Streptomyces canus TaxID=58343 RepID=UPI00324F1E08|nr:hypothetical protein OG604_37915 [Streptomyces sp. NBC_01231]
MLYTMGAGSIDPVPEVGNVDAAAAALRNWVINLHKQPAGTGVQAARVSIDVSIGTAVIPALHTARPEQILPCTGTCTPPTARRPSASSASDASSTALIRPMPSSRRAAARREDGIGLCGDVHRAADRRHRRPPGLARGPRRGRIGREGAWLVRQRVSRTLVARRSSMAL